MQWVLSLTTGPNPNPIVISLPVMLSNSLAGKDCAWLTHTNKLCKLYFLGWY